MKTPLGHKTTYTTVSIGIGLGYSIPGLTGNVLVGQTTLVGKPYQNISYFVPGTHVVH